MDTISLTWLPDSLLCSAVYVPRPGAVHRCCGGAALQELVALLLSCSVVLYITCLHMHALERKIMLALCNLLLLILLAESALI